jgi:hypothetical protein
MSTLVGSPLPSRHAVRNLLEGLVGRDVDISDGEPVPPKVTNIIAVFVTDKLAVSALGIVNLEAGARLGGALGMLPKGGVEDMIAERDLTGAIKDNCYEVLNVMSAVFNVPNAPHVRLYEMYGPNGNVPADIAAMAAAVGNRMDVRLRISGYGDGLLSLVCR